MIENQRADYPAQEGLPPKKQEDYRPFRFLAAPERIINLITRVRIIPSDLIDESRYATAISAPFTMPRALKPWLPVILWMGLIFFISTDLGSAGHTSQIIVPLLKWVKPDISVETIDLFQTLIRKGGHLTEYAILALLTLRAINLSRQNQRERQSPGYFRSAAIALLIAATYAATDEFHQSFIPSRTSSIYDVLIDTTGAFVALTAATLWKKLRGKTATESHS
jgi:VanZ family protein